MIDRLNTSFKPQIEVSVKQKKQIAHELDGHILPFEGHTLWEVNNDNAAIEKAKFSDVTYMFGGSLKKEVIKKEGFTYISALNKKNALKKFKAGANGSKDVLAEPLKLSFTDKVYSQNRF